ncbi:hypothetical protein CMK12_07945 [Candidatus Poribacteria bacterium]|nr:hypothetical protein [Candidatus Poribacteria bacterium]
MSSDISYKKQIVFSAIVLVVFICVLELLVRLIFVPNPILNINIGAFRDFHPTREIQLKPNYRAGGISINSHGILGPEFTIQKKSNVIRVVTFGDSVTFGPLDGNYPKLIEQKINAKLESINNKLTVEVICAAIPGYSSNQSLLWYDEFLHKLKPDITTIYLGWNDCGQFHPFSLRYKNERNYSKNRIAYRKETVLGKLMKHIYLLRVPYFFLGRMERNKKVDLSPLTEREKQIISSFYPIHYQENLIQLINKLQVAECKVFLYSLTSLLSPSPTKRELGILHFPRGMNKKLLLFSGVLNKYKEALNVVSNQTKTPIIDLDQLITSPEQRIIFTDTMHINKRGAEQYANLISNRILKQIRNNHKSLQANHTN